MVRILLPLLFLGFGGPAPSAQDDPARMLDRASLAKNEVERDRILRLGFEAVLAGNPEAGRRYLPLVIDRPWLGEMDFHDACALAREVEKATDGGSLNQSDTSLTERLVLAVGLHNPSLALREHREYLPLESGRRLFDRFVLAAPDEAVALASGATGSAHTLRELMSRAGSPESAVLARIAEERSIDLPRRGRVAILARRIARGELSFESALKIAGDTRQFFATVLDMRAAAAGKDVAALDRALEKESLALCRGAKENLHRTLAIDFAQFRTRDLYVLLSLGRAEAPPEVFAAVFDRLLLPKLKAEGPKGHSLFRLLDETNNWELRGFATDAIAAGRFGALLSVEGREFVDRLARGVDRSPDPLEDGMRLAAIIDATTGRVLREQLASIVAGEFARCRAAGDLRGTTIYGLLGAKLAVDAIAAPYLPVLRSSETLDTAVLFGDGNRCIQRIFFYDDEDGVKSFQSFRRGYQNDPAWKIEDHGRYVHLTGRGRGGRQIEIYANVPINAHLPENKSHEGEAERRQQTITEVLAGRGLAATVFVHRGHTYWEDRTLGYVANTVRLVILGDCRGVKQIQEIIDRSHDAQVIATHRVGATEINDGILKALNDQILQGERTIRWSAFWRKLSGRFGGNPHFRNYVPPDRDSGTVFLRSYYQFLDALN